MTCEETAPMTDCEQKIRSLTKSGIRFSLMKARRRVIVQNRLQELVAALKVKEALVLAKEMLNNGEDPMAVLETCRKGVEIVGKRFEDGKCFIPDLLMSGEIMQSVSELIKPYIPLRIKEKKHGKVLIGTVEGDIHEK